MGRDPNRERLIRIALALGDLRDDVVFVGGAVAGLLITDPAAPAIRPTKDVDVIIEVAGRVEYQFQTSSRLTALGFQPCTDEGAPICAWTIHGIRVGVMPTDDQTLGFTNRWYGGALSTASPYDLDGTDIQLISPPYFLATKLEAFSARGQGDFAASHDLEDVMALVDGRPSLEADLESADEGVRAYVRSQFSNLLENEEFRNILPGLVDTGREELVLRRLRRLTGQS